MGTTAIVLAGAGARGAYEAGILSVLVPRLLEEPSQQIVLVGTSAGAINTAILAAYESPDKAVAAMTDLWTTVDAGDVFTPIRDTALQTAARYVAEVLHLPGHLDSLLDSRPLGTTMEQRLDWDQLDRNLAGSGWVHTAGIVATSCARGRGVVFVQGKDLVAPKRDADVDYAKATLRSEHVMASAAIPVAFRPVHIEAPAKQRGWYIDGGVKLNAPIKPALALGADRVVVVATTPDPAGPHASQVAPGEPDIFDASTVVMHSLLVDRMSDDIRALRRVNTLVAAGRGRTLSGYRAIPNLYLGPPKTGLISQTANEVFSRRYAGIHRPLSDLGLLGRLIGGTRENHGELLSFVFFDHEFHQALIDLGHKHASRVLGPPGSPFPWALP
ncbi:MAG: patatin-like phospholipase family protein [Acidimicrobiia bacterium]